MPFLTEVSIFQKKQSRPQLLRKWVILAKSIVLKEGRLGVTSEIFVVWEKSELPK